MTTLLIVLAGSAGALYGRLHAAVAERVFAEERLPLVAVTDLMRPWAVRVGGTKAVVFATVASAGLFAGTAAAIGDRWVLPAYLWFVSVIFVLTLTDVDRKLIPNRILFPGFGVGAALLSAGSVLDGDAADLLRALGGSAVFFGFLLVVALAARGGFGMGDVKLGAMLGAFLAYEGWDVLFVGAAVAFVLGGVVSLVLLVTRIKSRRDAIPFGPYLVVGAYVAVVAGAEIADWYAG